MTTAPAKQQLSVFDIIGDYMPGDGWSERVRHLVPPNDNGDKEWSRVMEEVWRSPGFGELCAYIDRCGLPEPIRLGHGKVLDGNRMLVAAARVGDPTACLPVVYVD